MTMYLKGNLENIPLYNNDNQESPQTFDPTPKTFNKQLTATIAMLEHKRKKVLPQGGGVYNCEGLPQCP